MSLSYPIRFIELSEGGFVAMHPSLNGCKVTGNSISCCLDDLEDAKKEWIANALETNDSIPIPDNYDYSNIKFLHVYSESGKMLYSIHVMGNLTDIRRNKKKNKRKDVFKFA